MIVPMKKANIIVQLKDAHEAISRLRQFGLLHVKHNEALQSKYLSMLQEDMVLVDSCLDILRQQEHEPCRTDKTVPVDWRVSARHIIDLWKRRDHLESYGRVLANSLEEWEAWGDFEPDEILRLREKGLYFKLFEAPHKEIKDFPEGIVVRHIFTARKISRCLAIARKEFSLPFKEVALPKQGVQAMRKRLLEDKLASQQIKKELSCLVCLFPFFMDIKNRINKEVEFYAALAGMAKSEALTYITGFVPFDGVTKLAAESRKNKWGFLVTEPAPEDNVPTLIRNPRWVSLIAPIFKFLEILPGYHELDISLPFLIFFSIFFGILIGDAGYGLVYCLITFFIQQKVKKKNMDTSAFLLFYILSGCAIIWGVLTGTFFGHEWVMVAGYKPLAPALNDDKYLQRFCFLLGALHLSIAHSWRAILKSSSLNALADIGWILVLWAAFFTANTLILNDAFPFFGKWLIIVGVILVVFFTNPQKNLFKTIGAGLGTLALSLMNNFTDVVSYVRLFAVGLAGVAIADAFNGMARMVGHSNIFTLLVSILILVIGHILGVVLGPVSVLVHGVRLNVLEFSGHANVSWSGLAYKPLKE